MRCDGTTVRRAMVQCDGPTVAKVLRPDGHFLIEIGRIKSRGRRSEPHGVRPQSPQNKMSFETEEQKRSIQRWSRLAIQLNGADDSGKFQHITTSVIARELEHDRVWDFLVAELPAKVWNICKLSDVDRHQLAQEWKMMSKAYDPEQFHVSRSGLALLVAYVLHMIDIRHATIPQ